MAIVHQVVTVGTGPTLLVDPGSRGFDNEVGGTVENFSAVDVFIGTSDVAASGTRRGLKVAANTKAEFALGAGDKLYGVVAAGTADVLVIRTES